jgi:hypothetical protein
VVGVPVVVDGVWRVLNDLVTRDMGVGEWE